MKLFSRLTPHHRLLDNPLFSLETRRIPWGASERSLLRRSARRTLIAASALASGWLALALVDEWGRASGTLAAFLFAISLLAGLLLDCISMAVALGSINGERTSGRWDLLRLTTLTLPQIVAAKHGIAQVRAWRSLMLLVALRLAVLSIAAILWLLMLYRDGAGTGLIAGQALSAVGQTLVLAGLGAIYVLEPLWRVRMVTALGVAVSSRVVQGTSAVLLAFAALGGLWLAGLFLAAAVAIGVAMVFAQVALMPQLLFQPMLCSPILLGALFVTIYGFYSVVQLWSLRRAELWIMRRQLTS